MNVIPITDDLADSYHGAGYALAAVTGGRIMKLVYIEDVAPQLELSHESVTEWILSPEAAPVVRELQALGLVSVGMCSGWEFTEL